jgi:hypothetical protein
LLLVIFDESRVAHAKTNADSKIACQAGAASW